MQKKEFQLLEFLLRNRNKVVTRGQIYDHVWGRDLDPLSNAIDVHVSQLRKKLENGDGTKLIHTAHGYGYIVKG
jgi:DNA-binding response OmpR family regulator